MSEPTIYPYSDGDVDVIGPECFTDGEVICYRGENYTRQPRTITTAEELDALQMAVIRSDAGTIANIVNGRAYFFGYEASTPAAVIALPATVLYEPTA